MHFASIPDHKPIEIHLRIVDPAFTKPYEHVKLQTVPYSLFNFVQFELTLSLKFNSLHFIT